MLNQRVDRHGCVTTVYKTASKVCKRYIFPPPSPASAAFAAVEEGEAFKLADVLVSTLAPDRARALVREVTPTI